MAKRITDWIQARTTVFALAFFVVGTIFQLIGKLDATYISFMVSLLGCVIGQHAVQRLQNTTESAKQLSDLATRHLPHVHAALEEIKDKVGRK